MSQGKRNGLRQTQKDRIKPYDPVVTAAWLYYRDELSQQEIANRMGMSRSSVSNLLAAAKQHGVYSVRFDTDLLQSMELSEQLKATFGIRDAYVVPSLGTAEEVRKRIGNAGALYLTKSLGTCRQIGVCWGQTVFDLGEALPFSETNIERVLQMVGIARSQFWKMAEACNSTIGFKLGAEAVQFPAPGRVSSRELFDLLVREPIVAAQFEALQAIDAAIFGICALDEKGVFFASGLAEGIPAKSLADQGVVGIIGGRMFDQDGQTVSLPGYDDTLLALHQHEISRIPQRLGVAGGAHKVPAILGALRGGWMTALVTDHDTATELVQLACPDQK